VQPPPTSTVPRGSAQVGRRVAVYARVSTTDQTCDAQLRDLREHVAARNWQAREFIDQGVSGAKERRPALDRLMAEVKARRVDRGRSGRAPILTPRVSGFVLRPQRRQGSR